MAEKIETIRKAVCKNRGGWSTATDTEIMTIWAALDKATQEKYLKSVSTGSKKDGTGNKPGTEV